MLKASLIVYYLLYNRYSYLKEIEFYFNDLFNFLINYNDYSNFIDYINIY